VKTIATCLGVARSHLHDRLRRTGEPPPKPRKAEDAAVLQLIRQLVEERPTYGYRRITALLRRQMARENGPAINHNASSAS
jgi:putative transposase